MTENQRRFELATAHFIYCSEQWGNLWALENAFARGRWPQTDKEWRQTPHGASWDTAVEMAGFRLRVARKMAGRGIL